MSEKTPTKETSGELTQLADFAKQVIEGIAQTEGLSERAEEAASAIIKKAIELWQKDPENYEKELEELKEQLSTTVKDVSPEEAENLGKFVITLLKAQEKLLSTFSKGLRIGQLVALIEQRDNIINLLRKSPRPLKTIKNLFKENSFAIFSVFDNINLTFKIAREILKPEVWDHLEKQGITGKNITATAIPWAVVKTYQEQIKANPKDIFTIISAFQAFALFYPSAVLLSPIDIISIELSNAYDKYVAPVFKGSRIGLYSHLMAINIGKAVISLAKFLPKDIQAKMSGTDKYEEKEAKQIAMLEQERRKILQALRGREGIER